MATNNTAVVGIIFNDNDSFDFNFNCTSDAVEKILDLKKHDFKNSDKKPGYFSISGSLNPNVDEQAAALNIIIDVLDHFRIHNVIWESFLLHYHYFLCPNYVVPDAQFIRSLLHAANTASCFKKLHFSGVLLPPRDMLSGINLNQRVESIIIGPSPSLTNADAESLNLLLRTTKTLRELTFGYVEDNFFNSPALNESLAANKTLQKLGLRFGGGVGHISDGTVANIISSLAEHPSTIQELTLDDDSRIHDWNLTSNEIRNLLITSTTLTVLNLEDDFDSRSQWNEQHILEGVANSRSLKVFNVNDAFRGQLDRILLSSQSCSSLERIGYYDCAFDAQDMELVTNMDRRKKPIVLELLYTDMIDRYPTQLNDMLRSHPELRLEVRECADDSPMLNDRNLLHIMDFNRHGRYLLDYYPRNNRGEAVPVSLWSLVLEKAKDKPSIMYEFLKSEAYLDTYIQQHVLQHKDDAATIATTTQGGSHKKRKHGFGLSIQ